MAGTRYTRSAVEIAVGKALCAGLHQRRAITTADLANATSARVPLTETMSEQIAALRTWASRRAKPASSTPEKVQAKGQSRAARIDL